MKNLWSDAEARKVADAYIAKGINPDLAIRVYTTRLLGSEPKLVLHGGGNTSVKTKMRDVLGKEVEVLCVKGSGWDMGVIEPPGLPAVRLAPLLELATLDELSDEDMVNAQRCNLLDSNAPNPSVETLLHAFLPHKFIDHTHANPVLALCDQPNGEAICREVFGNRVALVPYIMPGFALAKKAKEVFEAHPDCEGMILLKHGIFSFGDTAKQAYDRMLDLVNQAEAYIAKSAKKNFALASLPKNIATAAEVAPILRGLCAITEDAEQRQYKRWIIEHRDNQAVMDYVNSRDLSRYSQVGVVTPDHSIRTKAIPLILPAPEVGKLDDFTRSAEKAIKDFGNSYRTFFERNNHRLGGIKKMLDPVPRVILVPGVGMFAIGKTAKDAAIAADVAENAIDVITMAEKIGTFESIPDADLFDIEYWSLEQAKLGKGAEPPLGRQVVVITGGASGIGAATAKAFAKAGAAVAVLDLDAAKAIAVAKPLGGIGLACDVTDPASVTAAFAAVARHFGGVDILVSNAGAAWQGRIGDVEDKILRDSFELNFFSHQNVAKAAVSQMAVQKTGGCLLFNASKQAVNPGPNFGPYGLPKAATLFLSRQYAVDYGDMGIRSNAVNADRIRSGLLTNDMIATRSKARGLSEAEYMGGNLLKTEVTAENVAEAFLALALAEKSTGAVLTVDGGNIAAALR